METHPKAKQQEGRNKENQSRKNRSGGRIDRGMVSKDCLCSRMHRRVLTDVCWLEPAVKRQHVEMVWNGQPEREIQVYSLPPVLVMLNGLHVLAKVTVLLWCCAIVTSAFREGSSLSTWVHFFSCTVGKKRKKSFKNANYTISYWKLWWFVKSLYCSINESCCYCYKIFFIKWYKTMLDFCWLLIADLLLGTTVRNQNISRHQMPIFWHSAQIKLHCCVCIVIK